MAVNISLYDYNFVNNISLHAIIIGQLARGDFNALKGISLGKAGIDNSVQLASNINKYISKINSINKSRD